MEDWNVKTLDIWDKIIQNFRLVMNTAVTDQAIFQSNIQYPSLTLDVPEETSILLKQKQPTRQLRLLKN